MTGLLSRKVVVAFILLCELFSFMCPGQRVKKSSGTFGLLHISGCSSGNALLILGTVAYM